MKFLGKQNRPYKNFLEENFLEKRDSQMRRQGRNRRQVPLPDKGMGVGFANAGYASE
jgi:hypothetical protein